MVRLFKAMAFGREFIVTAADQEAAVTALRSVPCLMEIAAENLADDPDTDPWENSHVTEIRQTAPGVFAVPDR